jgi:hypothetical protein
MSRCAKRAYMYVGLDLHGFAAFSVSAFQSDDFRAVPKGTWTSDL